MKTFKSDIIKIYKTERGILFLLAVNLILSIVLFVYAITKLSPELSVLKIGYGDIDGYRDGTWVDMLAFPMLAVIFGIFHSLLAVKIFHKRGSGMTKFFLLTTIGLIIGTALVLARLTGEV